MHLESAHPNAQHHAKRHYVRLVIMAGLSFIAMYLLMYAMVNRFGNIYPSFNQAYMAGLMTAPMVVIELVVMSMMYPLRRWNITIMAVSLLIGVSAFYAIRMQWMIEDEGFLHSMIPHHSGAILMCRRASLSKPELRQLCASIIESQQQEIEQMEKMLNRDLR